MRIRLDLAYDGTGFHGWAAQPGLRTVEGELAAALATVLRTPEVAVTCAGRTDAGVHARGQVVHVDLAGRSEGPERLARRLNGLLPPDVRVHRVVEAPVGLRRAVLRVLAALRLPRRGPTRARRPVARGPTCSPGRGRSTKRVMNAAATALVGEHDFAAFCKQREGATTIRTLLDLRLVAGAPTGCSWRACVPTRSATAWSARWSAACWRSATGAGRSAWAGEVLLARAARLGGGGGARPTG